SIRAGTTARRRVAPHARRPRRRELMSAQLTPEQQGLGRFALWAVAVGVGAGLLARLHFAALPEPWNTLANTSALWGLAPFLVGYLTRARGWRSAVLGIATLAVVVATWVLLSPIPVTPRELLMW